MSDRRPLRLGWWLSSEEHDPRELVEHARVAETIGFDTAMISDHLRPWVRRTGHASFVWTTLGAIAHATDRIEVGTGVVAMIHRTNPIVVAHAAATAAVMFEGRFFLGVGTGERLNEQAYGQRWPRPGERRAKLREAVTLLHRLWAGDTVEHRGEYWTVESLDLATRPAVPPALYVAASGPRSAALAGEIADGLIGVVADGHLTDVFRASGGAGKPQLGQLHISLASTIDDAVDAAREWWPIGAIAPELLTELARPRDFEAAARTAASDAIHATVVCTTSAAPIIEAIDKFVAAGFDTIYLHQIGPDQRRLTDVASSELLPHYRTSR
jgi:coenzyme F420-dependent glucose-6-phosphate dehydrogenase